MITRAHLAWILPGVLYFGSLPLEAQKPAEPSKAAPAYVPDPKLWKLYIRTPLGGWTSAKELDLEVKLVDPKDPNPPKDEAVPRRNPEYDDEEGYGEYSEASSEPEIDPWRSIVLQCWINGEPVHQKAKVGHATSFHVNIQDGENRIEIREPKSGQRAVRTFWGMNTRDRLVIRLVDESPSPSLYHGGWWWGGLQVVEPDSTESIGGEPTPSGGKNQGRSYRHATPLLGTYTVRWYDTRAGVDGYEYDEYFYNHMAVRPQKVSCEIVLDANTDRERRWRFESLVMPGTKRVTLGSFDVED
jgi:hypothetical protein